MIPIRFPAVNKRLRPRAGAASSGAREIPIFDAGSEMLSLWKLTPRERFSALFTGLVWCRVFGRRHPPIILQAVKTAPAYAPPLEISPEGDDVVSVPGESEDDLR